MSGDPEEWVVFVPTVYATDRLEGSSDGELNSHPTPTRATRAQARDTTPP